MNSDYIMRIIEQFVKALAAIIRARKAGQHEEAFRQIQITSQDYLKTDILSLLHCSAEECLSRFRTGNEIDSERCVICADLLYELALIFDAKQLSADALRLKKLSLQLYQSVIPAEPHHLKKIELLAEELGPS